jgi:hypothetical protein
MRPVRAVDATVAPPAYAHIKPGDRVDVEMKDGRRETFRVQAADGVALHSPSGQRYARSDMSRLRRRSFSHAKTWPLVAGGAFFVFLGIGIAVAGLPVATTLGAQP